MNGNGEKKGVVQKPVRLFGETHQSDEDIRQGNALWFHKNGETVLKDKTKPSRFVTITLVDGFIMFTKNGSDTSFHLDARGNRSRPSCTDPLAKFELNGAIWAHGWSCTTVTAVNEPTTFVDISLTGKYLTVRKGNAEHYINIDGESPFQVKVKDLAKLRGGG